MLNSLPSQTEGLLLSDKLLAAAEQDRASTPGSEIPTTIPTPGDLHQTVAFAPLLHRTQQQRRRAFVLQAGVGGLLVVYLVALLLAAVLLVPRLVPYATVTLVPETSTLSTTLAVSALTSGTPEPTHREVGARRLSVMSPAQSRTVPSSGTGHAPARAAQGSVTFYNAAPYSQALAAGTVLTGADGVEVVTDQPALFPAGNPPTFGITMVPAHATHSGPQGNIAPLDLNGLCCLAGVSVKNTAAFRGGQDAYDYPMVTQEDIEGASAPLIAALSQATQASLQGEVRPNERLAGPVQCQTAATPNHPVGSDASQVTVRVAVICQSEVYDHEAIERLVTGALTQQAATTLDSGYHLHGTISLAITQTAAPNTRPGTLTFLAHGQGVWAYQVSTVELVRLTRLIAGVSRQEAARVLARQAQGHIQHSSIRFTGWWTDGVTLPRDPAHIHLLVVVGGTP